MPYPVIHPGVTTGARGDANRVGLEARTRALEAEVVRLHEARLEELEEKERLADRLARLVRALPAGVVVLDGRGVVREANPAAEALLGEHLVGTPWRELIARCFRPEAGADLTLHDGRLVTLQTCPLDQEPGQILLLQEVTDRRRVEAQVEQTRRLAEMGRMAASLAHQVRTPLASALLYVSQLNRPDIPQEKRESFIRKSMERLRDLERLINEMLAYTRGHAGEGEWLTAQRCLARTQSAFEEACAARDVRLVVENPAADLRFRANATLLATALGNLVNNALQSASPGGRIRLSARCGEKRDVIDLIVEDDGAGVPDAMRAQLFEPFATTRAAGSGLGLAVVRAVARAHGGEAWYEPLERGGSRFGVRLPLPLPQADEVTRRDDHPDR